MADGSVVHNADRRKGDTGRLTGVALTIAAGVLAFLLYRPDTPAPFEIIDFSETLPFLTGNNSFWSRTAALLHYYAGHGRATVFLSSALAAKWTLFGWWTPGWQWTRFAVCMALVILTWRLLRVLGASRTGASAGAALFIVAEAVAPGWFRPSVNEPFGALLLVAASLIACRYQWSTRPVRDATLIGILVACVILAKETLVATAYFPLVLGLCREASGEFHWPRRTPRNALLLRAVVIGAGLALIPSVIALTQLQPQGYARQYGAGFSLSSLIFGLVPTLVPFTPVSSPPGWSCTVADIAWLSLLLGGWRVMRTSSSRRNVQPLFAMALSLPIARALVYLPWPVQYPFYSIPFMLGTAIIFGAAVSASGCMGRMGRAYALASVVVALGYASTSAFTASSRQFAIRRLTFALVGELPAEMRSRRDTVLIAVPAVNKAQWMGLSATLSRYASATGSHRLSMRDVPCDTAAAYAKNLPPAKAIASLRWQCGRLGAPSISTYEVALRPDPDHLRIQRDTLWTDFFGPVGSSGRRVPAPLPR